MNRCSLAHRLWLFSMRRASARFAAALDSPHQAQQELLLAILTPNRYTQYGKRHQLDTIQSLDDYRQRVPLCRYEDLEEDIQRIRHGEPNALTAEPATHLIPTSGTTRPAKLIPYTAGLQRQFNAAIGPWITGLYRENPSLLNGPSYWSISPSTMFLQKADDKVPIGFDNDTAYLGRFGRWLVDATLAVPGTVRHLVDREDFQYATLWYLLRARELRLVSVWHPSFWTLLTDALPRFWDSLTQDLAQGVCNLPSGRRLPVRSTRPGPNLAQLHPTDWRSLWPRLSVFSAWGDAAAEQPLAMLAKTWPHLKTQPKGVLSTEAFLSIPWRRHYPAAVTSHVIELLKDDGACIDLSAADIGGEYEPVVTTAGGLYRYRTGDRIRITGRCKQTPTLRLLGRQDQTHDVCGEKLHEQHVKQLLDAVFENLGLCPTFVLMATADPHPPTHYELFMSAEADDSPLPIDRIRDEVERRLQENPHYGYARRLGQLRPLAVYQVGHDAHHRYLVRMSESGQTVGGIKPALINHLSGWRPYLVNELSEICADTH